MKNLLILWTILLFWNPNVTLARIPETISGSNSAQWIQKDGFTLFLNGRGTHSIFIFSVYEASLFLENRSNDPIQILASRQHKVLYLKFLRDISASQLREAISTGFNENCANQCDTLRSTLSLLLSQIQDIKEDEQLEFHFLTDRIVLRSSAGAYFRLNDPHFGRVLLSIWLGLNPPSERIKRELLGLAE